VGASSHNTVVVVPTAPTQATGGILEQIPSLATNFINTDNKVVELLFVTSFKDIAAGIKESSRGSSHSSRIIFSWASPIFNISKYLGCRENTK
jgi:hypothetical protein